eukprot:scaffold71751_cov63-Phaeocystis_antarctica.AAC.1
MRAAVPRVQHVPVGHEGEQEAQEEEGECCVEQPADRKTRQEEGGIFDAIEERRHRRDHAGGRPPTVVASSAFATRTRCKFRATHGTQRLVEVTLFVTRHLVLAKRPPRSRLPTARAQLFRGESV